MLPMKPAEDSVGQAEGPVKATSWLRKAPSLRDNGTTAQLSKREGLGRGEIRSPSSPLIQAGWPADGNKAGHELPLKPASLSGTTEPQTKPFSEILLIDLVGRDQQGAPAMPASLFSEEVHAVETPDKQKKPLSRSESSDSIDKILGPSLPTALCSSETLPPEADSPDSAFSELPNTSGNPFSLPPSSPPLPRHGRLPLRSQVSMPVWNGSSYDSPFTGSLQTAQSSECSQGGIWSGGGISSKHSAPLPGVWLASKPADLPPLSRSLSRGQSSILDGSWSAKSANIDPCEEILVNCFAEFSKDMIPAEIPREPMRRQQSSK